MFLWTTYLHKHLLVHKFIIKTLNMHINAYICVRCPLLANVFPALSPKEPDPKSNRNILRLYAAENIFNTSEYRMQ